MSELHILRTIGSDGSEGTLRVPKTWRSKALLPVLQEAVDGYIETVYIKCFKSMMIVDEDGSLKQKPINERATMIAGQKIVGSVVLIPIEIWRSWE